MAMRLLIGYDGSESADAALDDLQKAGMPREVKALIISVAEVLMPHDLIENQSATRPVTLRRVAVAAAEAKAQAAQAVKEAQELVTKAGERVRSYFPDWEVQTEALTGWPSDVLIQKADEWTTDLVVVGSQGRSALGRLILGSVSRKVVTDSHHSVRVARGTGSRNDGEPPRILVGVDGSPEAEHAVRAVGRRVWQEGTELRIIAVDDRTSPARISRILPRAAAMIANHNKEALDASREMVVWAVDELRAIGLRVSSSVEKGNAQKVLIDEGRKWNASSIFVGSRKFSGALERFQLGSVSTAIVSNAHCSVEVVRSATS